MGSFVSYIYDNYSSTKPHDAINGDLMCIFNADSDGLCYCGKFSDPLLMKSDPDDNKYIITHDYTVDGEEYVIIDKIKSPKNKPNIERLDPTSIDDEFNKFLDEL